MYKRYGYKKIAPGGHRFWKLPENLARSLYSCVASYRKRNAVEVYAKMVDGGVFVWRE